MTAEVANVCWSQGSQAKKPYNPIIGEHCHCSWKIPNISSSSSSTNGSRAATNCDDDSASRSRSSSPGERRRRHDDSGASSGDASGDDERDAATTNLYYCAEQVSHHPPVSAFYFESVDKQMYMEAAIWTKSKFLGMSIGVVMVGKSKYRRR